MYKFPIILKQIFLCFLLLVIMPKNIYSQYQYVNNDNTKIFYRVFGKGIPILIIGGGPGDNSNRYLSLCELLSKDFQCILVDQRGTGKSIPDVFDPTTISLDLTIEDFGLIRKKLGYQEWVILGFSYGGYVASYYVNKFPDSVSKLILLESIGLNTNVFNYFSDNINSKLLSQDLELIEYWSDSIIVNQDPHHALVERIRAKMPGYFYDRKKSLKISQIMKDDDFNFKIGQWIWKDIIENDLNLAKWESEFNNPVLIIHGRQDPVGESIPHELNEYYKDSKLVFIEKAGHYSWIEQPLIVKKLISNFLK